MRKLFSTIIFIAVATLTAAAQGQKGSGYPISQVPFTSVKLQQSTFWGQRLRPPDRSPFPWPSASARARGATAISCNA